VAGRRSARNLDVELTPFGDAFLRVCGAIVLDTLAFVVWNVGTRSPLEVIAAVRRALPAGRSLFAGILSGLVGLIFVVAAGVLLLPAIAVPQIDFVPAELFTLLVALALEHLIGNDLRALAGGVDAAPR
jgi:hypothetical protein